MLKGDIKIKDSTLQKLRNYLKIVKDALDCQMLTGGSKEKSNNDKSLKEISFDFNDVPFVQWFDKEVDATQVCSFYNYDVYYFYLNLFITILE